MKTIEEMHKIFTEKHFARRLGCVIESITADGAVCSLEVGEEHLNSRGVVQGGMLFSLGDFTFAIASHRNGKVAVTLNASINYISAADCKKLIATAKAINEGRSISVYNVTIYDENSTLIANLTITGFTKN